MMASEPGRKLLLIEFVGLPGSGKTTIAAALESVLRQEGRLTFSRREAFADDREGWSRHVWRVRYAIYAVLRAPRLVMRAIGLVYSSGQRSGGHFLKVTWNFCCVLGWYFWLQRNAISGSTIVVDQGLAQAIWSIRLSARHADAIWWPLLEEAGLGNAAYVVVSCPLDIARQRVNERANGRSRISRSADSHLWMRAQEQFEHLNREISGLAKPLLVCRLDNNGSGTPAEVARGLLSCIDSVKQSADT